MQKLMNEAVYRRQWRISAKWCGENKPLKKQQQKSQQHGGSEKKAAPKRARSPTVIASTPVRSLANIPPRLADELKQHEYLRGVDWQQVFLRRMTPPLVPPRGEVNAADAFDIGNFDEGDVKGVKLTESDNEIYKNFDVVISDRWQEEIVETVFQFVNEDHDKTEQKRRIKFADDYRQEAVLATDCIVEGEVMKLGGPFLKNWEKRHLKLYPNRMEFYPKNKEGVPVKEKGEVDFFILLVLMTDVKEVIPDFQKVNKTEKCIVVSLKNENKIAVTSEDIISIDQWKDEIQSSFKVSHDFIASMNKKVSRLYGTDALDVDMCHSAAASLESLHSIPSNEHNALTV